MSIIKTVLTKDFMNYSKGSTIVINEETDIICLACEAKEDYGYILNTSYIPYDETNFTILNIEAETLATYINLVAQKFLNLPYNFDFEERRVLNYTKSKFAFESWNDGTSAIHYNSEQYPNRGDNFIRESRNSGTFAQLHIFNTLKEAQEAIKQYQPELD